MYIYKTFFPSLAYRFFCSFFSAYKLEFLLLILGKNLFSANVHFGTVYLCFSGTHDIFTLWIWLVSDYFLAFGES